ncbi:MAG: FAD binding domain-containing protein [Desulfosarcinaceae bacterium]
MKRFRHLDAGFRHLDAGSVDEALALKASFGDKADLLAGGTDLLGILKTEILDTYPEAVINLKAISGLDEIRPIGEGPSGESLKEKGLQIGAMARLADIAESSRLEETFPMLCEAAASVGSPELRNMATIGGNLCQDTRCWYYRYPDSMGGRMPCYRKGKGPCHAIAGDNRYHAIFGGKKCYAVCPSDLAVALTALDAQVVIQGPGGRRTAAISDFYGIFGPKLEANEMVTQIHIPSPGEGNSQRFLKFRLREAVDFAVVSAAACLTMDAGICRKARIVLGGVAPGPHIAEAAQNLVIGSPLMKPSPKRRRPQPWLTPSPCAKTLTR